MKCRMCSGSHETQECLVMYKRKQDIVHRCPSYNQAHPNPALPVFSSKNGVVNGNLSGLLTSRKSPQSQQLPGTFVWGQQLPTASQLAPGPAPTEFSPLPPIAAAPCQPPTTSLPVQLVALKRSSCFPPPGPPSSRIISSLQKLRCTSSIQTPAMSPQTSPSAYNDETRYYQLSLRRVLPSYWKRTGKWSRLDTRRCSWLPRLLCHLQPNNTDSH